MSVRLFLPKSTPHSASAVTGVVVVGLVGTAERGSPSRLASTARCACDGSQAGAEEQPREAADSPEARGSGGTGFGSIACVSSACFLNLA